jgi:DNA-binding MarR family transcriptional regulator
LALAKPTITAAVDGLVERGFLLRSDIAGDRRAVRLSITAAGRGALKAAERSMAERLAPVFDRVGPAVLDALADVGRALDDLAAERLSAGGRR